MRKACKKLKSVIYDKKVEGIYCSTPIGGTVGRLCGKKYSVRHVVYAAHGFLFFKGNGFLKNLVFKIHEKYLARYTDSIVTITNEDYNNALTFKMKGKNSVYFVHGAGVRFDNSSHEDVLRKEFPSIDGDSFTIISGGYLNKNKNNSVVIRALSLIKDKKYVYIVCGEGKQLNRLKKMCNKYKLNDRVIFAGFREDFSALLSNSDCFVMPSFREGVPRSLLEAMSYGLPCIGSDTRGIRDLIGKNNEGGILCNPRRAKDFARAIKDISSMTSVGEISKRNIDEVKKYCNEVVVEELKKVFIEEFSN